MKNKILSVLTTLAITSVALFPPHNVNAQNTQVGPVINLSGIGKDAIKRNRDRLSFYLEDQGGGLGRAVFLRVFVDSEKLELWQKAKNGKYKHIRTYKMCNDANNLKLRPSTGIYQINSYDFSKFIGSEPLLKTNYPNNFDQSGKYYNSQLNIVPYCKTPFAIGLTDTEMEELFTIVYYAARNGQANIQFHIYPFEMNWFAMVGARADKNYKKYQQLEKIYNYFESNKNIPAITINKTGYRIRK